MLTDEESVQGKDLRVAFLSVNGPSVLPLSGTRQALIVNTRAKCSNGGTWERNVVKKVLLMADGWTEEPREEQKKERVSFVYEWRESGKKLSLLSLLLFFVSLTRFYS